MGSRFGFLVSAAPADRLLIDDVHRARRGLDSLPCIHPIAPMGLPECLTIPDVAFRKECVGAALRREGWRTVFIAA